MPHPFNQPWCLLQTFKLVLCAALLLVPQVVLQLTAWSYMLVRYTQESSIPEAVADTFSGQRPCELCHIIETVEQEKEKQTLSTRAADDFRLLIPKLERVVLSSPPLLSFEHPQHVSQPPSVPVSTPAPPPKALS